MGEEEYHKMIGQHIEFLSEEDRATKEENDKRLSICKDCEKLNAGTCLSCGCYVEIRAAIKKSRCPNKKW